MFLLQRKNRKIKNNVSVECYTLPKKEPTVLYMYCSLKERLIEMFSNT